MRPTNEFKDPSRAMRWAAWVAWVPLPVVCAAVIGVLWINAHYDHREAVRESPEAGLALEWLMHQEMLDCDRFVTADAIRTTQWKLTRVRKWMEATTMTPAQKAGWDIWISYGERECAEALPEALKREADEAAEDAIRLSFPVPGAAS